MRKKLGLFCFYISLTFLLSGCDFLWFSGGAAGGYYVGKNYNIEKK